jgi:quercetin 2,3-dioxygenase
MALSEAIIFLAEKRDCSQNEEFRSYLSIPNQNYIPYSDYIFKFADNTLSPQKAYQLISEGEYYIIFLPLIGAIEISDSFGNKIVNSGDIGYYFVKDKDKILIQNPYENEFVNYIEIWIKSSSNDFRGAFFSNFKFESNRNNLIEISDYKMNEKIYIGKFDGRNEDFLNEIESAFVFVINGVFEVNNRLLESRSGLLLWNLKRVEFEGLGVENIILIISK